MIWFFEKKGQYVRCETRKGADGGYELVITEAGGAERVSHRGRRVMNRPAFPNRL